MNIVPIIPSLNPDDKLVNYVKELIKVGFKKIIIINDGSSSEYDKYFDLLSKKRECTVLKHAVNQGKGRALKTGFNYYLNYLSMYEGVVTADSDGQHSIEDTLKIANSLVKNKKSLILGTRDFNLENVPFNSRNGNKLTTFIFKLLYGKQINDTQTGLRGLTNDLVRFSLSLSGERFEYEINMLIGCVVNKVDIKEEAIETIYLDNNKDSHFNIVQDSLKIYKVILGEFFRFTFSGIFSFLVDILIFNLFISVFLNINAYVSIVISTILARLISSFINFTLNKNVVFNSKSNKKKLLIKYYTLCIMQMLASALFVSILFMISPFSEVVCKVIVDLILFFISYRVQSKYIFKK